MLNLKPILTLDAEGKVQTLTKTFGGAAALDKMIQLACCEAAGKKNLRFGVAHANATEKAKYLVKKLARQFDINKKDIMIVDVSPALGAHAGPGATGVAFLGE